MSNKKPWYRKPSIIVALIGALALILVAIIGLIPDIITPPEPQPQIVTIQGKVTDENKMPFAGVLVSCNGQNDITAYDGRYVIRDIPAGGVRIIRVEYMNREVYKIPRVIENSNKIISFDIALPHTPTITPTFNSTPKLEPPNGYIEQASWDGDCLKRPTGSECIIFGDGYIWLVYDSIHGWGSAGEWQGNLIEVAEGSKADYYHIKNTNYVKRIPTPTPIATPVSTPVSAVPTPTPMEPGFEVVLAIAGLLAVAYLLVKRR